MRRQGLDGFHWKEQRLNTQQWCRQLPSFGGIRSLGFKRQVGQAGPFEEQRKDTDFQDEGKELGTKSKLSPSRSFNAVYIDSSQLTFHGLKKPPPGAACSEDLNAGRRFHVKGCFARSDSSVQ